jgi:hypothetical protein
MGKDAADETYVSRLGNASLSEKDFVHDAIEGAYCIIRASQDVVETSPYIRRVERHVVVHVNYLGALVGRIYFPQIEVIDDIAKEPVDDPCRRIKLASRDAAKIVGIRTTHFRRSVRRGRSSATRLPVRARTIASVAGQHRILGLDVLDHLLYLDRRTADKHGALSLERRVG